MKKSTSTNMIVLKPTRVKPKPGDLFVCNMRGERWIAGRVIHDQANMFGGGGNEVLLYFYSMHVTDPGKLRPPFEPELLIPPVVTNTAAWRDGVFKTIANYPLFPEERLPRHYFRTSITAADGDPVFVDEFDVPGPRPAPGDYWDGAGLDSYAGIDIVLSRALGIPLAPDEIADDSDDLLHDESGPSVVLLLPGAGSEPVPDIDEIEAPLDAAVSRQGVGRLEGHGFDLNRNMWDIRFYGPDADALADSMLPILRELNLPGAYLVKKSPGKKNVRVDL